jgi:hypothetical protein
MRDKHYCLVLMVLHLGYMRDPFEAIERLVSL